MLSPGCVTPDEDRMILATTTSMRDSGLLDVLLPAFTNATVTTLTWSRLEQGRR